MRRAGIAVAQHAMLARTFTTNLAFAFSVVVGCTQIIAGANPNANPNPNQVRCQGDPGARRDEP